MVTSETINKLSAALAKAQGEITGALKDSANPFFKSKYADLASCWDACRDALSKNGIAVIQVPENSETGIVLHTTLAHSSGQWIRGSLEVHPADSKPQSVGSALTYARRYALTAFVGVAQVDDDGNAGSGKHPAYQESHTPVSPEVKHISDDRAREIATSMRGILELDLIDDVKSLKVLDKLDELNKKQDEYQAGWGQMAAAERKYWKVLVDLGKKVQDRPMMANGRA